MSSPVEHILLSQRATSSQVSRVMSDRLVSGLPDPSWIQLILPANGSSAADTTIPFVIDLVIGDSRPLTASDLVFELEVIREAVVEARYPLGLAGSTVSIDQSGVLSVGNLSICPTIGVAGERGRYRVSGELILQSLLEQDENENLHLGLTVVLKTESQLMVSERSTLSIFPRNTWFDARGGFSFPATRAVHGGSVLIEGWAVRRSDSLSRVEIFLNDILIGGARTGLSSPTEHRNFPLAPESETCRFSLWMRRADVVRRFGDEQALLDGVQLTARCRFASGLSLVLRGLQLRFLPEADSVQGEVEAVRIDDLGLVQLEGYLLTPEFERWRLFLEGRAWRLELKEGREVTYHVKPEIQEPFPILDRNVPAAFQVRIHPAALGQFPGIIRLAAESPDGTARFEFGPKTIQEVITERISEGLRFKTATARAKAVLSRGLCRIGRRQEYAPVKRKAPRRRGLPARVLVAAHNLSAVEGAPKVLFLALRALIRAGVPSENIRLIAGSGGELQSRFEELGIAVEIRPELQVFQQHWARFHGAVQQLDRDLREWSPEMVLANVIDSFWALDYAARRGIPSLICIHESVAPFDWFPDLEPRLRQLFLHRLKRTSTIFVAGTTQRLFQGLISSTHSSIVRNAIAVDEIAEQRKVLNREEIRSSFGFEGRFVVSVVGTTTWRKGQDVFLDEMARVKAERPDIPLQLLLVGARDVPFLRELQQQAETLGLSDQLSMVAETPAVAPFYEASDVIVLSSREESSPLVSLEAFAFERPLVSTGVFGLAEQLEGGRNALVVSHQDVGSMAAAVIQLYDRPDLARQLVDGGTSTLEHYTVEAFERGYVSAVRSAFENFSDF